MAEKLQSPELLLEPYLAQWEAWSPTPTRKPWLVRKLAGDSNHNFQITDGTTEFVIRVNQAADHLGVDRALERDILKLINDLPFAPILCCWADEYLVTIYQPAQPQRVMPGVAAEVFQQLHSVSYPEDLIPLDPLLTIERYLQLIPGLSTKSLETLKSQRPASSPFVLSHVDPGPGNLIMTEEGPLLIDWEYAQPADPAYDLAVYAETHGLSAPEEKALLEAYGTSVSLEALHYYRLVYQVIEILWYQIKYPADDFMNRWRTLESIILSQH